MNKEEFKESCPSMDTLLGNIKILDDITFINKIDDALLVKELLLRLRTSITRGVKVLSVYGVLLTSEEHEAIKLIDRAIAKDGDTIREHDFIIINSLTRRILEDEKRENRTKYVDEVATFSVEYEIDVLLGNQGLRCFHSIVKLYYALLVGVRREFSIRG